MEFSRRARRRGVRQGYGDRPPSRSLSILPSKRKQDVADGPSGRSRKKAKRNRSFTRDRSRDSTVFVRDLDIGTTSAHLKAFFENYGDVAKAKVVFEQGYGFVTFEAKEIAQGVVVAAAGKEGIRMGNRKIRVSWASGSWPELSTGIRTVQITSDLKKRSQRPGPPRRFRSRLFLSAVTSAVASATAEAVIQGNGPGPVVPIVPDLHLPNREVIAYDDWL